MIGVNDYDDDNGNDGEGDAASSDVDGRRGRTQLVWVGDAVDVQFVVELKSTDAVTVAGCDVQSYGLVVPALALT